MKDEEMRQWIDGASYEELLRKWRHAPAGSPYFRGEIGKYYAEKMKEKRDADPAGAVAASKNIGW